MSEQINKPEDQSERIPNDREILNIFEAASEGVLEGGFEISRSLEDEKGLCILEVQGKGPDGETIQFNYIRAGSYPGGSSMETVIDVLFFDGETPVGGHPLAKLKDGKWTSTASAS